MKQCLVLALKILLAWKTVLIMMRRLGVENLDLFLKSMTKAQVILITTKLTTYQDQLIWTPFAGQKASDIFKNWILKMHVYMMKNPWLHNEVHKVYKVHVVHSPYSLCVVYVVHVEYKFSTSFDHLCLFSGSIFAAKHVTCRRSSEKKRMQEEVEIVGGLDHPKIMRLYRVFADTDQVDDEIVLILEYLSGRF